MNKITQKVARNRNFLRELFVGDVDRHALIMSPPMPVPPDLGDFILSDKPLKEWVPSAVANYREQERYLELLDDDSVPSVRALHTNTGVFAAAFGCKLHKYVEDVPACALPLVETDREAEKLKEPDIDTPPLDRVWAFARVLRRELGPDAPICTPDIQSPFDIAALIWKKEAMFMAMYDAPDAVLGLVEKCNNLLKKFLKAFKQEFPECNLVHCPVYWAPPELGCSVSEDEAGAMSTEMFDKFCLPFLVDLSKNFGGLFMHCCAAADHQYGEFLKIPNLRGLNRVFQSPGPKPAIEAFSGNTVLLVAWTSKEGVIDLIKMAKANTRYLFNFTGVSLEEGQKLLEELRPLCKRNGPLAQ